MGISLLYHAVHVTVFGRIALWPSMLTDDATFQCLTRAHVSTEAPWHAHRRKGILITKVFSLW